MSGSPSALLRLRQLSSSSSSDINMDTSAIDRALSGDSAWLPLQPLLQGVHCDAQAHHAEKGQRVMMCLSCGFD